MKIDAKSLSKLLGILDKINRGLASPRLPDRMGRFLREYETGRAAIRRLSPSHEIARGREPAISGQQVGPIEAYPITQPQVTILDPTLGEVAHAVVLSEELGGLLNLDMWLKATAASTTLDCLRSDAGVRLNGDYRWTPPTKLTTGTAQVEPLARSVHWCDARCLKAVAEDIGRPPHALEYMVDYSLGPPALKFFRCVCALSDASGLSVLPATGSPRTVQVGGFAADVRMEPTVPYAVLLYTEPWSAAWTIVAAVPTSPDHVVAHAIGWADFQAELAGEPVPVWALDSARRALRTAGLKLSDYVEPNLSRSLLPTSKNLVRFLRRML